jgi:hypothetical protein
MTQRVWALSNDLAHSGDGVFVTLVRSVADKLQGIKVKGYSRWFIPGNIFTFVLLKRPWLLR